MLTCVERAFAADGSMYAVTRSVGGAYVAGRWQKGATSDLNVLAVVEPLKPEEILRLDDARHVRGAYRFYTLTEVYEVSPTGDTQPDVVTINSRKYEVEGVSDWEVHDGGYKAILVRREAQAHDA